MRYNIILIILLISSLLSFAQKDHSAIILNDSTVAADDKLSQFIRIIRKDWNVKFKDSCMTISLKDSVWVAYYNASNRSFTDTSEKMFDDSTYIKQNGKKILPKVVFHFEYKWTKAKVSDATKINYEIYQEVVNLKKKYHLEHLQEWHKWGDSGFIGGTPDDENRIKEYFKERKILEDQRINLPLYSSSNYCFNPDNENWQSPIPYMVAKLYPREKVEAIEQYLEDSFLVHSKDEN